MKKSRLSLPLLAMSVAGDESSQYRVLFNPIPSGWFSLDVPSNITFYATLTTSEMPVGSLALFLLQIQASGANLSNLVEVQSDICIYATSESCFGSAVQIQTGTHMTLPVEIASVPPQSGNIKNLLFCMATNDGAGNPVCDYYSEVFSLSDNTLANTQMNSAAAPTAPFTIAVNNTSILTTVPVSAANVIVPGTSTSYLTTSETTSTVVMTTIPAVTSTTSSPSGEVSGKLKSSSLSVGAKVGIALGALALIALLLLLALFFLRRKHSKRATEHHQTEQVMLTRSMHTDSFGRPAIITEKEEAISSAAALNRAGDSPVHGSGGGVIPEVAVPAPAPVPQTRHTVLSPYDPIPSAPYTGTIGTSSNNKNNIPRRKPTGAPMASTVSRGLSTASTVSAGPISPRSAHIGSGTIPSGSEEFETYRDVQVYGDARHVPQVYNATRIPFLGEETQGMSPEEVARLEEEERRIDLAIAEAERR